MLWVFYLYLGIGILAFVGLLLVLIFGGIAAIDFDVDIDIPGIDVDIGGPDADIGGGPGPFSLPVLLGFLSAFGALGSILTYYNMYPAMTPFVSAGGAILVSIVMFLIIQWMFKHFQSDSTLSFDSLKGKKATVTVSIKKGLEGQIVLFTDQRGRTLVPAVSDENIPENTRVVIVDVLGDSVKVRSMKKKV